MHLSPEPEILIIGGTREPSHGIHRKPRTGWWIFRAGSLRAGWWLRYGPGTNKTSFEWTGGRGVGEQQSSERTILFTFN